MSECCRKTFLFLAYAVSTVGSVAYCYYLIWLLAHVKNNEYYWFFAFPTLFVLLPVILIAVSRSSLSINNVLFSVLLLVMCLFTLLTRQAYYRLVFVNGFIGQEWVIMSLKGSIVFFISGFLARKECRLQKILEEKDLLTRGLLDFVDIFNLVDVLFCTKCILLDFSMPILNYNVTEGSPLEMAIQAFCTVSLFALFRINIHDDMLKLQKELDRSEEHGCTFPNTINGIYQAFPLVQNIPFLVIRIIVWARYNVFSLTFMVKNVWAIVMCCGEIFAKKVGAADDDEPENVNRTGQYNDGHGHGDGDGNNNASVITIQIGYENSCSEGIQ